MASTPSPYPTSIASYTTKVNKVDVYNDDHVNKLQNDVIAMQTYTGTNPHGNRGSLSDRVAASLSGSGGFILSTGVPVETYPGKFWYRTDLESLQNVKSDNTVQTIGGSFSNTLFSWSTMALTSPTDTSIAYVVSTSATPAFPAAPLTRAMIIVNNGTAFHTAYQTKFRKITGISNIQIYADTWTSGAGMSLLRFTVGSVVKTMYGSLSMAAPEWINTTLDVSGLANGTVYDVIGEMYGSGSVCYLNSIQGFGL